MMLPEGCWQRFKNQCQRRRGRGYKMPLRLHHMQLIFLPAISHNDMEDTWDEKTDDQARNLLGLKARHFTGWQQGYIAACLESKRDQCATLRRFEREAAKRALGA